MTNADTIVGVRFRTSAERDVLQAIDDAKTLNLLCDLIAAPSENPPGNEDGVVRRLDAFLRDGSLAPVMEDVAPSRPNLQCTLGSGPGPTLLLTGHTDTMPAGLGWTTDPHVPVLRDGLLFGRGACDMKAGLAAMASAVVAIRASGVELAGRVILEAVIDEEKGSLGARHAVRHGSYADYAIIGEPSELKVLRLGNGQVNFDVKFLGTSAHGSNPEAGHNAIYDAAAFIAEVERECEAIKGRQHPLIGPATYNVGTISGGVQTSIVPSECLLTLERRILPGQTPDDAAHEVGRIVDMVRMHRPRARIEWQIEHGTPAFEVPESSPLSHVLLKSAEDVLGDVQSFGGMRATSNAAIYMGAGMPTVVFGPGSITESAHRANEFVPVRELNSASRVFALTVLRLVGEGRGH